MSKVSKDKLLTHTEGKHRNIIETGNKSSFIYGTNINIHPLQLIRTYLVCGLHPIMSFLGLDDA